MHLQKRRQLKRPRLSLLNFFSIKRPRPWFDSASGHQETPKPPSGGFFFACLLWVVCSHITKIPLDDSNQQAPPKAWRLYFASPKIFIRVNTNEFFCKECLPKSKIVYIMELDPSRLRNHCDQAVAHEWQRK